MTADSGLLVRVALSPLSGDHFGGHSQTRTRDIRGYPAYPRVMNPMAAARLARRSRVWLGHVGTLAMSRRKPRASLAMIFLAWAKAAARAVIA